MAERFICEVIKRLASRHPRLSFHVHATDTATAYQALLARKVDLAVVHIIEPPAEDLMHVEPLLQDPHVVVSGAHNPIVRRRRLGLAELMEEPWALPLRDQPFGSVVDEAFRAHGPTCRCRLDTASARGAPDDPTFLVHGATGSHAFPAEAPTAQSPADRFAIDGETASTRP
jgi:DNA-binding transcriptional LysR family regulator